MRGNCGVYAFAKADLLQLTKRFHLEQKAIKTSFKSK